MCVNVCSKIIHSRHNVEIIQCLFFTILFIYERERAQERDKQTPAVQGAWLGLDPRTLGSWLSWRQRPNRRSHPGVPFFIFWQQKVSEFLTTKVSEFSTLFIAFVEGGALTLFHIFSFVYCDILDGVYSCVV